jgi:hypothetical protein
MRGNIVLAAAVLGLCAVLACGVLVFGARWALGGAAEQLSEAVDRHAQQTSSAGDRAGEPIRAALDNLGGRVARHAEAIEHAGTSIAAARVTLTGGPVSVTDEAPIRIRGFHEDGALPVDVHLDGKKE